MRMISFLGAPLADKFSISLQLPGTGKMEVQARLAWVKQRENVYTIGIEFVKMAEKDCDTRILLKLPEVCVGTCKCNKICNKIQKDETLFEDK